MGEPERREPTLHPRLGDFLRLTNKKASADHRLDQWDPFPFPPGAPEPLSGDGDHCCPAIDGFQPDTMCGCRERMSAEKKRSSAL
jgi:hypothetical protein